MKITAAVFLILALGGCQTTDSKKSTFFENEPNGFRGLSWGSKASDGPHLIKNNYSKNFISNQASLNKVSTDSLDELLIETYHAKDEKMTFGEAEMTHINYVFYKDKFYYAILQYPDSSNTPLGTSYRNLHEIGEKPPKYYDANYDVNRALEQNFGTPTDEANLFLQIAFKGQQKKVYSGNVTRIYSNCDTTGVSCYLTFTSLEIDAEFEKDLKELVKIAQEKNAKLAKAKLDEELKIKNKADF